MAARQGAPFNVSVDPLQMMFWQQPKRAADDVAREFSVTALTFAETLVQFVGAAHEGESAAVIEHRRFETCALIWATAVATFEASALSVHDRGKIQPLLRDLLVASWKKHGADETSFPPRVLERSLHYLQLQEPDSQLRTATLFINELIANLDAPTAELLPTRTLTALLAHRMLSDVRWLNEIKANFTIL
jgi:hypothetical protein